MPARWAIWPIGVSWNSPLRTRSRAASSSRPSLTSPARRGASRIRRARRETVGASVPDRSGGTTAITAVSVPCSPQLAGGDLGPVRERAELGPAHRRRHVVPAGEGGEPAVGAGDHPLASDGLGEPQDALRDGAGMLDAWRPDVDDTWHQDLVVRQLDVLEDLPLELVGGVRRLEGDRLHVGLEDMLDEVA